MESNQIPMVGISQRRGDEGRVGGRKELPTPQWRWDVGKATEESEKVMVSDGNGGVDGRDGCDGSQ